MLALAIETIINIKIHKIKAAIYSKMMHSHGY